MFMCKLLGRKRSFFTEQKDVRKKESLFSFYQIRRKGDSQSTEEGERDPSDKMTLWLLEKDRRRKKKELDTFYVLIPIGHIFR